MYLVQRQQKPGSESAAGAVDEKDLVRSYRTWKGSSVIFPSLILFFVSQRGYVLLVLC